MDASLRELGVGDLGVPREMRRIGEAFFGRQAAYAAALAAADRESLAAALRRNIFRKSGPVAGAQRMAAYTGAAVRALDALDSDALGRGELVFPDPR